MFAYKGYWLYKDTAKKGWWYATDIKTGRTEYNFSAGNATQAKKTIDEMAIMYGGAKQC